MGLCSSEDSAQWVASERFTGTYLRQIALGDNLDTGRIGATYDNGVLTAALPVAEKAKPRTIAVTASHHALDADGNGSTPTGARDDSTV